MLNLIYDPIKSGSRMNIVCFVSGSGTNYSEIVKYNKSHNYLLFTNRPGCGGSELARQFRHTTIELSHIAFLKGVRQKYGANNVPRNCTERVEYEKEVTNLVEKEFGQKPDLICLAGYDQWVSDWMVDRYYPRMLNIHPGDTTKGYDGLHWIPSAKAIIAGDKAIRSTVFIVDKGEDTGPVLVQSKPLNINNTIKVAESQTTPGLITQFNRINKFINSNKIITYEEFASKAEISMAETMEHICHILQDALKITGDWIIYPYAIHELVAKGRIAIEGRKIFIDGKEAQDYGWRM